MGSSFVRIFLGQMQEVADGADSTTAFLSSAQPKTRTGLWTMRIHICWKDICSYIERSLEGFYDF
jgi:hypothetical protein